jgi:hypothetical protein
MDWGYISKLGLGDRGEETRARSLVLHWNREQSWVTTSGLVGTIGPYNVFAWSHSRWISPSSSTRGMFGSRSHRKSNHQAKNHGPKLEESGCPKASLSSRVVKQTGPQCWWHEALESEVSVSCSTKKKKARQQICANCNDNLSIAFVA